MSRDNSTLTRGPPEGIARLVYRAQCTRGRQEAFSAQFVDSICLTPSDWTTSPPAVRSSDYPNIYINYFAVKIIQFIANPLGVISAITKVAGNFLTALFSITSGSSRKFGLLGKR